MVKPGIGIVSLIFPRYRVPDLPLGSQMYCCVYAHFCSFTKVGSMKDGRSRSNEYLVLQCSAHDMSVGANQAMIADRARMTTAAPDHCVLHDDGVCSDADPSPALTNDAGSIHNTDPRSDDHVAAYGGVGRHPSGRGYLWMFTRVSDQPDRVPPV
jgi:hypothetical protein